MPEIATQENQLINKKDAASIGHKIWINEGAGKEKNLISWDKKFASLGIGHFIWYPAGIKRAKDDQFPQILEFLQQQQVELPEWLQNTPDCPWNSHEDFYNNINSDKMLSLRQLLKDTIPFQVQFIIKRLEQALPKMMAATKQQGTYVRKQFDRVAQTPMGIYAIIDYVNFKGKGTSEKERYQGEGWGLLQVLENMPGNSDNAITEFVLAADYVLKRRIKNAPKDESHWLVGWRNRLKTYTY
ncbi:hypothetical protein PN36_17740 [Candidatus Thiomargarita nelsonii]|uniref:Uncharacterized protein n=1 Tax=Candidatus Thiomargarita nelsonii TaxID=1003181 RepID=A0A0A6PAF7_9GAMM|nr:hypothetical protein PN36_17740 [Candidatus Thiomargarita nelsonii]